MARRTYSSEVEAYVDAELAAAREAAWRESGRIVVSESASLTVFAALRLRFARAIRLYGGTALLALLPALVIAARAGLSTLPQLGIATDSWLPWAVEGVTIAAVAWAILVTLWQGMNAWLRAFGQPLISLRFRRNSQTPEYPPFDILAIKLVTALTTLPALVWLALSGGRSALASMGAGCALAIRSDCCCRVRQFSERIGSPRRRWRIGAPASATDARIA